MENKRSVTVYLTDQEVKKLKEIAKQRGFLFSKFIQNIILRALDEIEEKGCKAE